MTLDNPFPLDGVTLSEICKFQEECGGEAVFKDKTIFEVCASLVIPITKKLKSSYCDLLRGQNKEPFGSRKADIYVSQIWSCKFLDFFETLKNYLKGDNNNRKIWLALFSINHHESNESLRISNFELSIERIGHFLLVTPTWSPWVSLRRTWCLFEIFCCIHSKCRVEFINLSSIKDESKFVTYVKNIDVILNEISDVDILKSDATDSNEKALILNFIKEKTGVRQINELIKNYLYQTIEPYLISIISNITHEIRKNCPENDLSNKMKFNLFFHLLQAEYALQKILIKQEKYDESLLQLSMKSTHRCSLLFGTNHSNYISDLSTLGGILIKSKQFIEAERVLFKGFQYSKQSLGLEHELTLQFMSQLAETSEFRNKVPMAEDLYTQCIKSRRKTLGINSEDTLTSMATLGNFYLKHQNYEDAAAILEIVVQKQRTLPNSVALGITENTTSLSICYENMNKISEAEALLSEALELLQQLVDGHHPDILKTMERLGGVYAAVKEWDAARSLLEQSFVIRKELYGFHEEDTQTAFTQLLQLYDKHQAYQSSEGLLRDYLTWYERTNNKDVTKIFDIKFQLGGLYTKLQKYELTEKYYLECYVYYRNKYGSTHPKTVSIQLAIVDNYLIRNQFTHGESFLRDILEDNENEEDQDSDGNLLPLVAKYAYISDVLKKFDQAELLYQRCIRGSIQVFGYDHANTFQALVQLCDFYLNHEKMDILETLQGQFLDLFEQNLGADHMYTKRILVGLIELYKSNNKLEETEQLYIKLFQITAETLSESNLEMLTVLKKIVMFYSDLEDYNKIEKLYLKALPICEAKLGEENPETIKCGVQLASLYFELESFSKAELICKECLDRAQEALGVEHMLTFSILQNLARTLETQNKYSDVEDVYTTWLKSYLTSCGPKDTKTMRLFSDLNDLYIKQDKYTDAEMINIDWIQMCGNAFGREDPHLIIYLENLAKIRYLQERVDEADALFEECFQHSLRVLGEDHVDTRKRKERWESFRSWKANNSSET